MPSNNSCRQITANRLELPAVLENLPRFISFATDRAREQEFTPARTLEVELVLEEALVNVMEYAYPDRTGTMTLVAKPESGDGLRFEIRDRGATFDPLEREAPDLETGIMERQIGGLGIFLMKELADEIFWQRQNNENCLTIIFKQRHAQS